MAANLSLGLLNPQKEGLGQPKIEEGRGGVPGPQGWSGDERRQGCLQDLGERWLVEGRARQEREVLTARAPPRPAPDPSRESAEGLWQLLSWGARLPTRLVLWMRRLKRRE